MAENGSKLHEVFQTYELYLHSTLLAASEYVGRKEARQGRTELMQHKLKRIFLQT